MIALARRGVDSRRAHAPDRRGTAAVVVAGHPRERGPALVVERTERIADLGVLRLGVRAVQADVPVDAVVRPVDRRHLERQFDTVGLLLPGVHRHRRDAHRTGRGDDRQQGIGDLDVVVERDVDPVAPHGHVGSHVVVDRLLPGEVGISQLVQDHARAEDVGHPAVEGVGREGLVGGEILVAGITHRGAQLEQLEKLAVAKEPLVLNVPAHAHRPRVAETVVRARTSTRRRCGS